jgi:hypothetical protein
LGKTESRRYRELALQKHELAQNAADPMLKQQYVELADAYEKLAEQAFRIEMLTREVGRGVRDPYRAE